MVCDNLDPIWVKEEPVVDSPAVVSDPDSHPIALFRRVDANAAGLRLARLSPLFADFEGAPPIYLQASESEILRDDTLTLAKRLEAQGADIKADLWPDAPHVWQLFRGWVPEADDALTRVADFIRRHVKPSVQTFES